ncbi:MAG TPA: RnfABCDGE type electron transport complex subunit D [Spirochaetota bacterium]|nr:RnfABCDGE type electron transport complex subunit D [Spirochaetota bacterium]HOK03387.1 RnfABCDGE type electron transport complex subunit D [Spirochaetota bacterium]HON17518.1 RnfABCDGE type electron transport complex subunit D [Spirochaetota bacterium]HOQ12604.1 RnfABCDGE type electron transport complex subunit D [Spirochaetota bacterium]HPD78916.1 RnfABCDGE type electron transport complex subunit D [Spirochaetota bacterium]
MEPKDNVANNQVPEKLIVTSSPHVHDTESVTKIMWIVNLTLLPAAIFAVINFGLPALFTMLVCIIGSVAFEALIQYWRKMEITISDGSAVLTGLLLAMCLPPTAPWYVSLVGSLAAIGIAKHTMGGLGHNVFNPAHIGRAFVMASYPVAMTTWAVSRIGTKGDFSGAIANITKLDAVTTATPLGMLKLQGYDALVASFGSKPEMYKALFLGTRAGSLGETSALLLILGGLVLIAKKYIKWQVPVVMIGTVGILTWAFGGKNGLFTGDPILHMLSGGLIIGAFFMATDMVTTPLTTKGQILFAFGCGVITVLIRLYGGYPEGVCYSILLMNALTPLIDRYIFPTKFGSLPEPVTRR